MKFRYCFWAAMSLSLVVHAAVFASLSLAITAAAPHSSTSLPILVVAYGNSDREGLAVDGVAPDPGALRKGEANTPGGDAAPKPPADKPPPVIPPTAPPPPKPPEAPKPDKPAAPNPPPHPAPAPTPAPVVVVAADRPAPTVPSRPGTADHAGGGPALPGAPGGAPLPIGAPSAGGTVGSSNGVRIADGARPPAYPAEAREEGLEGTPVIWLRVSAQGGVLDARVQKSSGYKVLDDAALRWARSQKFIPASRDGAAVEAEVTKPVHFYLY